MPARLLMTGLAHGPRSWSSRVPQTMAGREMDDGTRRGDDPDFWRGGLDVVTRMVDEFADATGD